MVRFETDDLSADNSETEQIVFYANNLYPAKIHCFTKLDDETIYALVHCCKATTHEEDGILVERWKKEYLVQNNTYVPLLRLVSVDTFEASCFVVEDKHGLHEEYGSHLNKINNGVTLVKPRETACTTEFL